MTVEVLVTVAEFAGDRWANVRLGTHVPRHFGSASTFPTTTNLKPQHHTTSTNNKITPFGNLTPLRSLSSPASLTPRLGFPPSLLGLSVTPRLCSPASFLTSSPLPLHFPILASLPRYPFTLRFSPSPFYPRSYIRPPFPLLYALLPSSDNHMLHTPFEFTHSSSFL